jgi:hypothetical protein
MRLIFDLHRHRSWVRTLTTGQILLLWDGLISISPAIGTALPLSTCLKFQIRVQCIALGLVQLGIMPGTFLLGLAIL